MSCVFKQLFHGSFKNGHSITVHDWIHQEKMRDREGDAQSSPWDILISVKLFLDGTKTEVCFPRGPQSQQARVVFISSHYTMPYRQAPMSSYDVIPNTGGPLGKQTSV